MPTIAIIVFLFFSSNSEAKSVNQSAQVERTKKPNFVVKIMNRVKNRGSQINILRRHISPVDLRALKQQADTLNINLRGKLDIHLIDEKSFYFEDKRQVFKFSDNGKNILYGRVVLKIERSKSLLENYKIILGQIKNQNKLSAGCRIFACAYADASSSAAYNLTTLLYYMDVYDAGGGNIMWDMFIEDPAVKKATDRWVSQGKKIASINCDELGMSMTLSDGTKAYWTENGKEGSDYEIRLNEKQPTDNQEQYVEGTDPVIVSDALFFFCQKLAQDSQRKALISILNGEDMEPSTGSSGSVSP